jgi:hypothetical protein
VWKDARFDKTKTDWTFILIGNEIHPDHIFDINQAWKEKGILDCPAWENYKVIVKTRSEILQWLTRKYSFLKQKLDESVMTTDGFNYLQENYWDIISDITNRKKK